MVILGMELLSFSRESTLSSRPIPRCEIFRQFSPDGFNYLYAPEASSLMDVNYPENFESKIGFDRIRESVSRYCLSETAVRWLGEEGFLTDSERIREKLLRTKEYLFMMEEEEFAIAPYPDLNQALTKLSVTGGYLEIDEVVALRRNLDAVRGILNFFKKSDRQEKFPGIFSLSREVKIYPFILERIDKLLSKNGKIRDHASRELTQIRAGMAAKEKQLARRLQSILRNVQQEGTAESDVTVSIRNGRPVIPVPASKKRLLSGIIHDESASGKTVFIEPAEVVEINNEIRELEYAEKREVIRILTRLTDDLKPYAGELEQLSGFLTGLDLIQAKARYARDIGGIMPELMDHPMMEWKQAVHPLLFRTLQQEKRRIVPLDIRLDSGSRILVISGPNAGGKSVCLKTVGLLQYMVQCGFLVPMDPDSRVGLFDQIFIDIGDDQSIDNDLSTYSSHLLNMKYFIRHADERTLLLIDEFGTGTEPVLGGAIAEAILHQINRQSAWGVVTTHYSNLKHFAADAEGIENGAMLFDTGKMQPLYRLEIGQPGSSFAFEIARNIGLPEEIIKEASDRVGEDHLTFDRHLREIIRDKRYWEGKRDRIRISEKKLQETLGQYAEALSVAERTRNEILKTAREEAEELLRQANRKIENTIREIREAQAAKDKTRKAREQLHEFREKQVNKVTAEEDSLGRKIEEIRSEEKKIREKRKRFGQLEPSRKAPEKPLDPHIGRGDFVVMKGQEVPGEVLERKGNKVAVQFGHLTTRVGVDKLEKVAPGEVESLQGAGQGSGDYADWDIARRRLQFSPEIDVRGQRAEEALRNVTALIDEAIMVQHRELRILHGKGDGVLRQLIREYLGTVDLVESFGDEHVDLGGAGVTIVRLDV
jgi:DNA mismatch repair protein MutS2